MLDRRAAIHDDAKTGFVRDPRGFPVDDPELEPETAGARFDRLQRVRDAQLRSTEDIDDVEWTAGRDRLSERRERRNPVDFLLARIHRHAVVAMAEEIAEDAERWTSHVRGRADDCDPPGRSKHVGDGGVVEERDGSAPFLEVEVGDRAGPLCCRVVLVQVVASRSYGWPSAAGGALRPTTPARITIVRR